MAQSYPINTADSNTVYIDYVAGSDDNDGSIDRPLKTLLSGIQQARRTVGPDTIVMRNGTHFINETIQFTPLDNDLTIQVLILVNEVVPERFF